ncbi:methyl-accepting chemotaxis protein [Oscillatoria sp. CS-180]|uniref:methyl-accepting chemotaxis protein n=1 Tax=Oscillatoria sp. CS-180 TaxID=3021720 RepID=UPI00232E570B|nr:methyl-accepting chemotaxis protein [Oscillatoria sp. CS-180]MDB9528300.1 methyl-accepting chemotaxis protein [Oscillatoria sp. CS-180]
MVSNIFGGLQKLKVQHQILLLVVLSAAIPASLVGLLGTVSASGSLSTNAESTLQKAVEDEIEEIDNFLRGVSNDVLFMSKLPPIQGMIRAEANGGTDPQSDATYEEWAEQLQAIFAAKIEDVPQYMQLRYIDAAGNELVRVDSVDGAPSIIPNAQLQNKGDRDYFISTTSLSAGEMYVSALNLNREQGAIEEPYRPVIRYATPIVDESGQQQGIVIANVFGNAFLEELESTETQYPGEELFLVNESGYYLSHPDPAKEWGFDLGHEETLAKDFSPDVAEEILNGDGGLIDVGNSILAYDEFIPSSSLPYTLTVINQVPKGSVFSSVNSFKLLAGLTVLVSLGLVIPAAVFRGRQLVALLEKLAANISTSSQEMATTIAEQERIASQQAASVNETTTTMDELEASSRHAAEQANAAVEAAKQASSASEDGAQAVGESLEGMFALEQKVEAIAEQIVNLSGQTGEIGIISQLVMDFANQTNMLALNSSVEAVRAGEHGKGFAVVANEIRKLADQSQKSADRINTLVSDIQKAINETVMVTEEGTKTVKTGVHIAQRTEDSFKEVKGAVNQVVMNNQQVSLNLKQQVDAIQQVVNAMEVINRGAKETATGLNQTKVATEQLNGAAADLQQMV